MKSAQYCISKRLVVYSVTILFVFGIIILLSNSLLTKKQQVNSRASTVSGQSVTISTLEEVINNMRDKWEYVSDDDKENIMRLARGEGIDCPSSDWGEYFTCLLGKQFGEGAIIQRYATFQRLELTIGLSPLDSDKKDLFIPWIKFNGAAEYADQTQMPLVAKTLKHFLYGNGETLNISEDFKGALLNQNNKYVVQSQNRNISYLVGDMINRTLAYQTNVNINNIEQRPYSLTSGVVPMADALRNNKPLHIKIELVVRANPDEEDLINSLNQFTMYVEGDLVSSIKKQGGIKKNYGGIYYEVVLTNPKVSLYDRYDWRGGTSFGAQGDLYTLSNNLLKEFGVEDPETTIKRMVGDVGYNSLRQSVVRIADDDGARLVKYKFGKEFDIVGLVDVGNKLQFNVSEETLIRAEGGNNP
ncbi:hypothetical protein HZC27_05830 [Candidatus Roizmanbacteria bacterium]|nr:hypothetical protein [Candidatus Roizmanbacteria bacterium]